MSAKLEVRIADFSRFPYGRYPKHGPFNGERFRQEWLMPAFRSEGTVSVDLSGARGLSPSFLEEAFGGLVREGLKPETILARLEVRGERDSSIVERIRRYVREAGDRAEH